MLIRVVESCTMVLIQYSFGYVITIPGLFISDLSWFQYPLLAIFAIPAMLCNLSTPGHSPCHVSVVISILNFCCTPSSHVATVCCPPHIPLSCPTALSLLFPLICNFLPLLGLGLACCHFSAYLQYGCQYVEAPYVIYYFFCTL